MELNTSVIESTPSEIPETPKEKAKRGFALLSRDRVAQIASMGGKASHAKGSAHQFSKEEARVAGQKGGLAFHKRRGRGKVTHTTER